MARRNQSALASGALFVGGGLASYFTARWLSDRLGTARRPEAPPAQSGGSTQASPQPIAAAPSQGAAKGVVSRRFAPIFAMYAGGLPLAYLRALSQRESGLDPSSQSGYVLSHAAACSKLELAEKKVAHCKREFPRCGLVALEFAGHPPGATALRRPARAIRSARGAGSSPE